MVDFLNVMNKIKYCNKVVQQLFEEAMGSLPEVNS